MRSTIIRKLAMSSIWNFQPSCTNPTFHILGDLGYPKNKPFKNPSTVVRDDPKLPDDTKEVLELNDMVDGSIPGFDVVSLLDVSLHQHI